MITHIVLIKLNDPSKQQHCIDELRSLDQLDSVESIVVAPELGQAPNRWDIACVTKHKDAEQLEVFRVDEFHKKVGGGIAPFVEINAIVDFDDDAA